MYLQRLQATLEEDKKTLEQEAVLVKKQMQVKDERLKSLCNLIPYSKLGVMYPFVHVHLLFISDSIHNLQTVGDVLKKYAGAKVSMHVEGHHQS